MDFKLCSTWLLCVIAGFLYVVLCPFTKVEESFNLQAIHDHIYHGIDIKEFDHNEFPGVVPRSFIGSLMVGYIVKPFAAVCQLCPPLYMQYFSRFILCSFVLGAYLHFICAVRKVFGQGTAIWSCLLLVTQFHFLFYSSRPLPNTFAAIFALLASSYWLRNKQKEFVFFSGWTIIVFRSELAIMFGLMLLISIIYGNLSIYHLAIWIIYFGVVSLGSTVFIDSYYWQRWVWPEGEAFYFNAILNKSSEWGTSPFFWYFYSALPRAMALSLLLAPLGMAVDRRCLMISIPAFGFVLIYSLLPHKELRFILYVVPLLNIPVARLCSIVWNNREKGVSRKLAALVIVGHLFANLIMTAFLLRVSYYNYPGGYALKYLNDNVDPSQKVNVHIDVYSAQTGVSRFLNENRNWSYDKTEAKEVYGARIHEYSHLMVGTPDEHATKAIISVYAATHRVIHTEMCFKNIQMAKEYPYIDIRLAPCVWVLELTMSEF